MKTFLPVEGQMLVSVINATFMERCGKYQYKKPEPTEMVVTFNLRMGPDESGSRLLEVCYYADANYVEVRTREIVKVYNETTDVTTEETTDWTVLGSHDSGWRQLTHKVLCDERIYSICVSLDDKWFDLRKRM